MMLQLPERVKFSIDFLNSDKKGDERQDTLQRFKSGQIEVLVVTNVAARGIDITGITVVNYEFPMDQENMGAETYVHRIGRAYRIEAHDEETKETDKGQAFTIDWKAPDWEWEKLINIIHQAEQVAPKCVYEEAGQERFRVSFA
jgi:superfamily II DNA/RNA helicase